MKTRPPLFRVLGGVGLACFAGVLWTQAQEAPAFTRVLRLTNQEIALTLNAPTGFNYRIDAGPDVYTWNGLVTLPASALTSLQHTDSAAPFLDARYYRAQQLTGSNVFTGDHLATAAGDLIIQPRYHATVVLNWGGKTIYCDPNDITKCRGLPKADLILVTHSHSDHFNTSTIDAVRATNAIIVAPQDVYKGLTTNQKALATVLGYGASTQVVDLTVEAVPAYNIGSSYHPFGVGNGYVLTLGGKRVYLSGDTSNTPEMRQLTNIDVAFLCMNLPYTMPVNDATNAVSAFRPKVVYPYHYREDNGSTANAALFKQRLSRELAIEVRLRKWY